MQPTDQAWSMMEIGQLLEIEHLAQPDNADMLMQLVPRSTNTPLKGEGRPVPGFETPIQVVGWRWGQARRSDVGEIAGKGRGAVARMVTDLTVIKRVDLASPLVAKLCASNELLDNATLKCFKAGGQAEGAQVEYMSFVASEAVVRSYQIYTSARHDQPLEVFQLAFRRLSFNYSAQTAKGGKGASTAFNLEIQGG